MRIITRIRGSVLGPPCISRTISFQSCRMHAGDSSLKPKKDLWRRHKSEMRDHHVGRVDRFFRHPPRLALSLWRSPPPPFGPKRWLRIDIARRGVVNAAISFYKSLRLTRPFGDFSSRTMPAVLGMRDTRDAAFRPHCGCESAGSWKIPVTTSILYDRSGRVKFCRLPRRGLSRKLPRESRPVYRRERNLYDTIFPGTIFLDRW